MSPQRPANIASQHLRVHAHMESGLLPAEERDDVRRELMAVRRMVYLVLKQAYPKLCTWACARAEEMYHTSIA